MAAHLAVLKVRGKIVFEFLSDLAGSKGLMLIVKAEFQNDGKAVQRGVKTGDILNSSILITDGLRAGEQVVTAGASFLYDGAPIEVATDRLATR